MYTVIGYPFTAETKDRAMPVLPVLASTMVKPGFRSPLFSAFSIINRAIRSLMLPLGLRYSGLARTSLSKPSVTLLRRTKGVLPMRSSMLCRTVRDGLRFMMSP